MRRPLSFLCTGIVALAMMTAASFGTATPTAAATIAPTTTCNNALGNGGAVCEVTVVNTITPTGGSAVVTVRECTGSAGVPATKCTNKTTPLSQPVTAVTQCDGSISGGGGTLLCSVFVTNNFVGLGPSVTAVTVNQCVGSVTTGTVKKCSPFPATTTGATITQCNGSGNGGGTSLTCTATGTQSSGLVVRINQCNGSANGGGTRTVCSARILNNVIAGPGGPTAGIPNASIHSQLPAQRGITNAVLLGALVLLLGISLTSVVKRFATRSSIR
ncbi:MAG: hypothetical protein H0W81_06995 [Chloroflexi bacterium]|nr:hypothetical protein [Chloroflexota bacterium]